MTDIVEDDCLFLISSPVPHVKDSCILSLSCPHEHQKQNQMLTLTIVNHIKNLSTD
jgi:hypothetical protein